MSLPPTAPRSASNTSNTIAITTATTDIPPGKYHDDVAGVLIDEKLLHQRILQLGQEITDYYRPTTNSILVLTILKGAVLFVTDLVRAINIPTQLEFMAISSYGSGTTSSGVVRILKDLDKHIEGLDVLIVEDIIDSGLTLSWLMKNIATRNPRSLTVCTLLRKSDVTPKADVQVRFVGFDIPNEFVVGYGLDYEDFMRDLPYIGILKKSVYQNDTK